MSVHSSQKYRKRDWTRIKFKTIEPYQNFLERIRKTLYYGNLPVPERLSLPITELATELYSEVKARHSVQRLRLDEASEISRNACVSPCTLVLAIIYMEQLKASNFCYVDRVSPTDLFIVSLMVATKFLNDSGEDDDVLNSEWASSVGLTLCEVNRLEREFLSAINWEIYVGHNFFWERLRLIERDIALKEGNKRGWFSYTDLENLLDTVNGLALVQALFTVSTVCLASYTAGLLTILGSTLLVSQLPRYSVTNHSSQLPSEMFNVSTFSSMAVPPPANEKGDCEQQLTCLENSDISFKEVIEYLDTKNIQWNLDKETNTTGDYVGSNYFNYLSNYINIISSNFESLPMKIKMLPLDTNYILNCFS